MINFPQATRVSFNSIPSVQVSEIDMMKPMNQINWFDRILKDDIFSGWCKI